jgi:arylsulfatase A-like enzyme
VSDTPVEIRDVLPTLLDAAGVATQRELDGFSLLQAASGKVQREHIDLEHDICYDASNHWNALTDGKWKYIYHARDGEEQLFHIAKDPGELQDLAGEPAHTATLRAWRDRMIRHFAERGDRFVKAGRLVPRPERCPYSPNYPKAATSAD